MAGTPEELALDLSRASLQSQEQIENKLRLLTVEILVLAVALVVTLVS